MTNELLCYKIFHKDVVERTTLFFGICSRTDSNNFQGRTSMGYEGKTWLLDFI